MSVTFIHPWFAIGAAALALLALAIWLRSRRPAAALLVLGGAFLLLGGGLPSIGSAGGVVTHAIILDVSGSMEPRLKLARRLAASRELPDGHRAMFFQLSDAIRAQGDPVGGETQYARLADVLADPSIDGEIVLITDGRGDLDDLSLAIQPSRLLLIRAPVPERPDASVLDLSGPGVLPEGASGRIHATVVSDTDLRARWSIFDGDARLAGGEVQLRRNVPLEIGYSIAARAPGLRTVRFTIEVEGDREPRNDSALIRFYSGGKRLILFARDPSTPAASDVLLQTLRSDPRNQVRVVRTLPASAAELEGIAALIVHDLSVSASGIERAQLRAIGDWVRSGGNLMMAGLANAFGPGGYRRTEIEEVMPVTFRPDDDPPRRVLLLLDCSDSMNVAEGGGGISRLDLLRDGARRALDSLAERDQAAILGFNERPLGAPEFLALTAREELNRRIKSLKAGGGTYIGRALDAAIGAFGSGPSNGAARRLLLITDGEHEGPAGDAEFKAMGADIAGRGIRLDVVLTGEGEPAWIRSLRAGGAEVESHRVGGAGFAGLLTALEGALSGFDRSLIRQGPFAVSGIGPGLPALVLTAPRNLPGVTAMLDAVPSGGTARPLLYRRQLVGRSVALCTQALTTESSGEFWQHARTRRMIAEALDFLLAGSDRPRLVLKRDGPEFSLVWTGAADAPPGDLRLADGAPLRRLGPGRWRVVPGRLATELVIMHREQFLQRVPLPRLVPRELARTGNDDVFFRQAEERGLRVYNSLAAWRPRRAVPALTTPVGVAWIAALAGILLLLVGYGLRLRESR